MSARRHLALICEQIGLHIGEEYGAELDRGIDKKFCETCLARLRMPPNQTVAPHEEAAKVLMRTAARVRSIPARSVWIADSELRQRLEGLLDVFARTLMGPHEEAPELIQGSIPQLVIMQKPDGTFKQLSASQMLQGLIWAELSQNAGFVRRVLESYEAYEGHISFEQFRDELVDACYKERIASTEEAIPVLDKLTRRYAAEHLS